MTVHCAFCSAKLPANDVLTDWPVGKQLVFDRVRQRLWAVCPKCSQWNLAPLDDNERRRAIAHLDQLFESGQGRFAANGIGIAELADGCSVTRVGDEGWSSFAFWRFGKRLRRRYMWWWLGFIPLIAINSQYDVFDWLHADTVRSTISTIVMWAFIYWVMWGRAITWVTSLQGSRVKVRGIDELHVEIGLADGEPELMVPHKGGTTAFRGTDMLRPLVVLLARRNVTGAPAKVVSDAIEMIERAGGPESALSTWLDPAFIGKGPVRLLKLPSSIALALEMAASEAVERRILAGQAASIRVDATRAGQRAAIVETLG